MWRETQTTWTRSATKSTLTTSTSNSELSTREGSPSGRVMEMQMYLRGLLRFMTQMSLHTVRLWAWRLKNWAVSMVFRSNLEIMKLPTAKSTPMSRLVTSSWASTIWLQHRDWAWISTQTLHSHLMSASSGSSRLPLNLETPLVEFLSSKDLNTRQAPPGERQEETWTHISSPLSWITHQATPLSQSLPQAVNQAKLMSRSWSTTRDCWCRQRCSSSWRRTTLRNQQPEEHQTLMVGTLISQTTTMAYQQSTAPRITAQTMLSWVTLPSRSLSTALMRMSRPRSLLRTWFIGDSRVTTRLLLQMLTQRSTHSTQSHRESYSNSKQYSSTSRATWMLCRVSHMIQAKREGATSHGKW